MTLFGEIVEPSSRALFYDDSSEDEEHSEEKLPKKWELQWRCKDEMPTSLQSIIVVQGRLALEFFQLCISKADNEEVGEVKQVPSSEKKPAYHRHQKPLPIYKLTSDFLACLCPEVDHEDCNIILDTLLPLLSKSKQIILFTSAPAPLFKSSDPSLDLPPSFMRALYSTSFDGQEVIAPILEHPNIVSGISAAVLSWCEVFNVPGCLYICYSDSEEVDSISAEPLFKICSKYFRNVVSMSKLNEKSRLHDLSNNLYM